MKKNKTQKVQETIADPVLQYDWMVIRRFSVFMIVAIGLFYGVAIFFSGLLVPIGVGAFFAYLLSPVVDFLQRKGINRFWATFIILFGFLSVLAFALIEVTPLLYEQLAVLIHGAPKVVTQMANNVVVFFFFNLKDLGIRETISVEKVVKGADFFGEAVRQVRSGAHGILAAGSDVANKLMSVILIPLVAFFFILDKQSIKDGIKALVPIDIRPTLRKVIVVADQTLQAVIRGQLKVAAIDGVLYAIGFSIAGLNAGIAIGLLAGFCRFIPYLDAIVGGGLGIIYVLLNDPSMTRILAVLIVVGVVQILDGAIITPRIIGGKVGLHPGLIIMTVFASGFWFGFWGILLAIPISAVLKRWLEMFMPVYFASSFYKRNPTQ